MIGRLGVDNGSSEPGRVVGPVGLSTRIGWVEYSTYRSTVLSLIYSSTQPVDTGMAMVVAADLPNVRPMCRRVESLDLL